MLIYSTTLPSKHLSSFQISKARKPQIQSQVLLISLCMAQVVLSRVISPESNGFHGLFLQVEFCRHTVVPPCVWVAYNPGNMQDEVPQRVRGFNICSSQPLLPHFF